MFWVCKKLNVCVKSFYSYFLNHAGTIGRYDTTDKMLEVDPKTGEPLFITQPSHLDKSNISITNKWLISVIDPCKIEAPKPNKSPDLNLKSKEEMEELEKQNQAIKKLGEKPKGFSGKFNLKK